MCPRTDVLIRRRGTLALSWGPAGGFYTHRGGCKRVCIGKIAITLLPVELDEMMEAYVEHREAGETATRVTKALRRAYRQLSNTEILRNSQFVNQALETLRSAVHEEERRNVD